MEILVLIKYLSFYHTMYLNCHIGAFSYSNKTPLNNSLFSSIIFILVPRKLTYNIQSLLTNCTELQLNKHDGDIDDSKSQTQKNYFIVNN